MAEILYAFLFLLAIGVACLAGLVGLQRATGMLGIAILSTAYAIQSFRESFKATREQLKNQHLLLVEKGPHR